MDMAISYTVTSQQNCSGGLVENTADFISLIPQHPGREIQSVSGIQGQGEEKRDKMTTLCLSSKSSAGAEVFQMQLETMP